LGGAGSIGSVIVNFNTVPIDAQGQSNPLVAVGGDIELVSAAGDFGGNLSADRAIGTIRAATIANPLGAPFIIANADRTGEDGVIDLIDDAGAFGLLGTGGPHLYTGPGGNVRYLHLSDAAAVVKSNAFGGGTDAPNNFD